MNLTKRDIINYLVDVKGYTEEEAKDIIIKQGYKEYLTKEELKECIKFNN